MSRLASMILLLIGYSYACVRNRQRFVEHTSALRWVLFAIICLSPMACFLLARTTLPIPFFLGSAIAYIGGYWFAFAFYLILCTAIADALLFLLTLIGKKPIAAFFRRHARKAGIACIVFSLIIVPIGAYCARHVCVTRYEVDITAPGKAGREFNIVMVSDIHLGKLVGLGNLSEMVDRINALSPDLVLIAGDIFDNSTLFLPYADQAKSEFLKLQAKYGVYACLGNHDSYDGGTAAAQYFEGTQIKVLQDQTATIDNALTLVGRRDARIKERASIDSLLQGTSGEDLPIIVLDHEPVDFKEEQIAGVSLVLSGHSHNGQLFPINLATNLIYDLGFGYVHEGGMQAIVSSGYGIWATPVRIGNFSEIVQIHLSLKP